MRLHNFGDVSTYSSNTSVSFSLSNGKKQKKRLALSGTQDSIADREKKEKRARRFDQEKVAFEQSGLEYGYGLPPSSSGSGNLAGRLGAVSVSSAPVPLVERWGVSSANTSTVQPMMGLHDQSSWRGASVASGSGGKKWGTGMHSAAFADAEVADPVSVMRWHVLFQHSFAHITRILQNVIDWDQDTVVGLSTKLEKPYLRLTSAPDPKTVRTLPTLMQTLELLKKKWRTESNYSYICDQFKSMRQDLTVQRIKNDFTVKVYEIHARIALEKGDLGEYNQCQSQLRSLYSHGLPGCVMEFLSYRILYLLHTRNQRGESRRWTNCFCPITFSHVDTISMKDVNALMAELTPAHKVESAIAHSLQVRSSLATGNYHAFFRLYADAPNMNAYIMDHFIDRERANALLIMARW